MKREDVVIMFGTLVLIIVILCGAVIALSAKYNALETEHLKMIGAYEACEGGTP